MKWKSPRRDDKRLVRRFALLPETMTCEQSSVWLRGYWSLEVFDYFDLVARWRTVLACPHHTPCYNTKSWPPPRPKPPPAIPST